MDYKLRTQPTIPTNFIKNTIRNLAKKNPEEDLISKINKFAEINSYEKEEANYYFVKESIKNGLFFELEDIAKDTILYNAIYWASLNECRLKARPKSKNEIRDDKRDAYFTQLQKELIVALYKYQDSTKPIFEINLMKYLFFFTDLSCIKRNRK